MHKFQQQCEHLQDASIGELISFAAQLDDGDPMKFDIENYVAKQRGEIPSADLSDEKVATPSLLRLELFIIKKEAVAQNQCLGVTPPRFAPGFAKNDGGKRFPITKEEKATQPLLEAVAMDDDGPLLEAVATSPTKQIECNSAAIDGQVTTIHFKLWDRRHLPRTYNFGSSIEYCKSLDNVNELIRPTDKRGKLKKYEAKKKHCNFISLKSWRTKHRKEFARYSSWYDKWDAMYRDVSKQFKPNRTYIGHWIEKNSKGKYDGYAKAIGILYFNDAGVPVVWLVNDRSQWLLEMSEYTDDNGDGKSRPGYFAHWYQHNAFKGPLLEKWKKERE